MPKGTAQVRMRWWILQASLGQEPGAGRKGLEQRANHRGLRWYFPGPQAVLEGKGFGHSWPPSALGRGGNAARQMGVRTLISPKSDQEMPGRPSYITLWP